MHLQALQLLPFFTKQHWCRKIHLHMLSGHCKLFIKFENIGRKIDRENVPR